MIYEYFCEDCDSKFEKNIKLKDCDVEMKCPKCGNVAKKIPSLIGSFWMLGYTSKNGYSKKQKSHL